MKDSWIVFCDSPDWKNKILKKNFRHVYILTKDQFNWFMIDPDWRYLNVKILPFRANYNVPKTILNKETTILHIKHQECTKKHLLCVAKLFTCVEIVKYTLGISMFALTPYSLFKKLKRLENGKLIKESSNIFYVNQLQGGNNGIIKR